MAAIVAALSMACVTLPKLGDENDLGYEETIESAFDVETVEVEMGSKLDGTIEYYDKYTDEAGKIILIESYFTAEHVASTGFEREITYFWAERVYKVELKVSEGHYASKGISAYVMYFNASGKVQQVRIFFPDGKSWNFAGEYHYEVFAKFEFKTMQALYAEHESALAESGDVLYLREKAVSTVSRLKLNGKFEPATEADFELIALFYDEFNIRADPEYNCWRMGVVEDGKEYWLLCGDSFKEAIGKSFRNVILSYFDIGGTQEGPVLLVNSILF
jgi:hypothetical protein